jgi:hypothetical protein
MKSTNEHLRSAGTGCVGVKGSWHGSTVRHTDGRCNVGCRRPRRRGLRWPQSPLLPDRGEMVVVGGGGGESVVVTVLGCAVLGVLLWLALVLASGLV